MEQDLGAAVVIEAIFMLILLLGVVFAAWRALTAKEVYRNRLYGARYRKWLMKNGETILHDSAATPTARAYAATWLAYVYDPVMLGKHASEAIAPDVLRTLSQEACGSYYATILEGFNHLASLGMMENRRLGTAIRTIIGDGRIGRAAMSHASTSKVKRQLTDDRVDMTLEAMAHAPIGKETKDSITYHVIDSAAA